MLKFVVLLLMTSSLGHDLVNRYFFLSETSNNEWHLKFYKIQKQAKLNLLVRRYVNSKLCSVEAKKIITFPPAF